MPRIGVVSAIITGIVGAVVTAVLGLFGIGPVTVLVGPGDQAPPGETADPPREPDALVIVSDPPGAAVALDWRDVGTAPLTLRDYADSDLLVLTLPGHRAASRSISTLPRPRVEIPLESDDPSQGTGTIVSVTGSAPTALHAEIGRLLRELGWTSQEEPAALRTAREASGGSLTPAMMSWARARWGARLWIEVEETGETRNLGDQPLDPRLRPTLEGTYTADVNLGAVVFDLYGARILGNALGSGAGSGLDEARARQRARSQALTRLREDLAGLLRTLERH